MYDTASVVNGAAAMAFLPRLVEGHFLQRAHARTDGTDAAASTAGPALGGILVSAVGARGRGGAALVGEILHGLRWIYRGSGLASLAISTHGWFFGHAAAGLAATPFRTVRAPS